jgi:hypothetical protein
MTKALVRRPQRRLGHARGGAADPRCRGIGITPHCRTCGWCMPHYRGLGNGLAGVVDMFVGTGICDECFRKSNHIPRRRSKRRRRR